MKPMNLRHTARRRGSMLLGLLPLTLLLAAFCSIILDRSLETARASNDLALRLQARAAAQGAALALARELARDAARETKAIELGEARVEAEPGVREEGGVRVGLRVTVQRAGAPVPQLTQRYAAWFARGAGGVYRLERLEE